jgi:hypothetical protein
MRGQLESEVCSALLGYNVEDLHGTLLRRSSLILLFSY